MKYIKPYLLLESGESDIEKIKRLYDGGDEDLAFMLANNDGRASVAELCRYSLASRVTVGKLNFLKISGQEELDLLADHLRVDSSEVYMIDVERLSRVSNNRINLRWAKILYASDSNIQIQDYYLGEIKVGDALVNCVANIVGSSFYYQTYYLLLSKEDAEGLVDYEIEANCPNLIEWMTDEVITGLEI
jgi:hypothetical protein